MRTFLIQFLLALSIVTVGKGQVVELEYFLGNDPGIGKAITLGVSSGNIISGTYVLPLSDLPVGFNRIGVRAKDVQGRFSHTLLHSFYLLAPNSNDITGVEYFIDIDPGHGNGNSIPVQLDELGKINYVVPLADISEGSHLLGIRTKNGTGNWSQTKLWFFYNHPGSIPTRIVRLSYFYIGEGAPNKVYSYILPEPAASVDISTIADLNDLESGMEYTINLTAIDENGRVSNLVTATFSTIPPIEIEKTEIINLVCFGSNDGSVRVIASGGEGTLEYSLDGENYSSNALFENLASGNYTVYVRGTGNLGYVVEETFSISSPAKLTLAVEEVIPPSCLGDSNGGFRAVATGGTGSYRYKLQNQENFQNTNLFADLQVGTYSLTVVDENGCEANLEVQLQAVGETPPIPLVNIQGTDGISTEVALISSSPSGNQWLRNGEEILGATGQTLEITQPGSYQVKVTGQTGCTAISSTTVITSLREVNQLAIKLYPNPAEDRVKIDFGREIYVNRISIIASNGVVLKTVTEGMQISEKWLDLTGLGNGTYIIQVEGIGTMDRLKLIKQ